MMAGTEISRISEYVKNYTENFTLEAENREDVQYLFDSGYGFVRAIYYMGFD